MPYIIYSTVTGFESAETFQNAAQARSALRAQQKADPANDWQLTFRTGKAGRDHRKLRFAGREGR